MATSAADHQRRQVQWVGTALDERLHVADRAMVNGVRHAHRGSGWMTGDARSPTADGAQITSRGARDGLGLHRLGDGTGGLWLLIPPLVFLALRSFSWNSSLRWVDDQAGAAEVDEGDERLGAVEAEGAV